MDFLLEALTNWLKEMLVGGIMSNLSGMFDSVNQQVADISVQVGQTDVYKRQAIRTAYLYLFPDKKERKRALSRLNMEDVYKRQTL